MEKVTHLASSLDAIASLIVQWSVVSGQWSVVTGHWSLVIGHWSLNYYLAIPTEAPRLTLRSLG